MRWSGSRLDPHTIMKSQHIIDRTLNNNRVKMNAAGAPCTYFRNMAFDPKGGTRPGVTRCYCWPDQAAQPDKEHKLCFGTGYLEGYQKYGYTELTISTPSKVTLTTGITKSSGVKANDRFTMSSALLLETLTTEQIPLVRFAAVDRFFTTCKVNAEANRLEFSVRTNASALWTPIPLVEALSDISNFKVNPTFVWPITTATQWVQFKVDFKKKTSASASPELNSLRFRYRKMPIYGDINNRFSTVRTPAFLAAREQPQEYIEGTQYGWKVVKPMQWWVMPEVRIEENDVIRFLEGELKDENYLVNNMTKYHYGPTLQVLHRQFQTKYIRDEKDLLGIIHLLT